MRPSRRRHERTRALAGACTWLGLTFGSALLGGCGGSDASPLPPAVYAAYVVLGPAADGGVLALARAIVEPGTPQCPVLRGAGRTIRMRARGNPFGFPVNVCEARVPFDRQFRLSWTDQALPIARRNPARLAVLGDTGCKAKDCAGDSPAAPFDAIAAAAAAQQPPPELVVHLGDYNYRGTASAVPVQGGATLPVYDAGDDAPDDPLCQLEQPYVSQNAAYSLNPDTWEHWWADFFQPAAPLLAAAPWVVVRGNHELCSRAGPGWFYFLDPNAAASRGGLGELACPPQGGDQPLPPPVLPYLQLSPPYVLDLGTLRIAVVDSANACDGFAPAVTTQRYAEQLAAVLAAAPPDGTTWIATHRPLWGATTMDGDSIAQTLQQAWAMARAANATGAIGLVLSGHMHTFQSLAFPDAATPRPPQLIVGASGVELGTAPVGRFTAAIDGDEAEILGIEQHSFLHVESLAADGTWNGTLLDASGSALAFCSSDGLPESICSQ
ncbi:MAG: metallophosphoesterase [Candidatus Binatia bacterium]